MCSRKGWRRILYKIETLFIFFFLTDVIQKFEQLPNPSAVQTYICKSFRICQVLIVFVLCLVWHVSLPREFRAGPTTALVADGVVMKRKIICCIVFVCLCAMQCFIWDSKGPRLYSECINHKPGFIVHLDRLLVAGFMSCVRSSLHLISRAAQLYWATQQREKETNILV